MIFGGLPFIGAGHGDIFYPTSFLRLMLPVATVVNLGFVIHYIAAGMLTYAWLRKLRVSWAGAVVGGLAYQLSGILGSLPSPGHDGKLFASAARCHSRSWRSSSRCGIGAGWAIRCSPCR